MLWLIMIFGDRYFSRYGRVPVRTSIQIESKIPVYDTYRKPVRSPSIDPDSLDAIVFLKKNSNSPDFVY